MKILYIASGVTNSGGVSKVLSLKVNYFVEVFAYEIIIYSTNDVSKQTFFYFNPKIKLFFNGSINKVKKIFLYVVEIKKIVKETKPDFVIVCDNGWKSLFVPFFLSKNVRCYYELHNRIDDFINDEKYILKGKHFKRIVFFFMKKYKKIILLNSKDEFPFIEKERQVVIPNPIIIQINDFNNLQERNYKKAIAVGRIIPLKGYERLLRIWRKVVNEFPDYVLEIYGDSCNDYQINSLVDSLNLNKNVKIFNAISNIQEKYRESIFLVHPSYIESFSMVILEAMSFGLPVVCFDLKTDLVKTHCCLISKTEDEFLNNIIELINNKELRKELGNNGKKESEKFSIENVSQMWLKLFNS